MVNDPSCSFVFCYYDMSDASTGDACLIIYCILKGYLPYDLFFFFPPMHHRESMWGQGTFAFFSL